MRTNHGAWMLSIESVSVNKDMKFHVTRYDFTFTCASIFYSCPFTHIRQIERENICFQKVHDTFHYSATERGVELGDNC